jgi:hypothetical protein
MTYSYDRTSSWKPSPVTTDLVGDIKKAIEAASDEKTAILAAAAAMQNILDVHASAHRKWRAAGRSILKGMGHDWAKNNLSAFTSEAFSYGADLRDLPAEKMIKQFKQEVKDLDYIMDNLRELLP